MRSLAMAATAATLVASSAPARAQPAPSAPADDEIARLVGPELAAELAADAAAESAGAPASGAAGAGGFGSGRLLNPDVSLVGIMAGSYYTADEHPSRGGHVPAGTGFTIQECEFALEAAVDPYFYWKSYFVFGLDYFEIEEAFAQTLRLPWGLAVRAGQMLAPLGRANQRHSHLREFVDAPLPVQRFLSGEGLRSPGLEVSWLLPTPFYLRATAAASTADAPAPGTEDGERTFGEDRPYDFVYLGRLETFVPFDDEWSLMAGAGVAAGPAGQGRSSRSEVYGGDLFLRYKPVSGGTFFEMKIAAEGMLRLRHVEGKRLRDWGVYGELVLRLSRWWRVALRGDAGEGDLLRGESSIDPPRAFGEERGSASVTLFPTEFSQVRLQGTLSHPHGADWPGGPWGGEVFLQATFSVGAHGAHPF